MYVIRIFSACFQAAIAVERTHHKTHTIVQQETQRQRSHNKDSACVHALYDMDTMHILGYKTKTKTKKDAKKIRKRKTTKNIALLLPN